MQKLSYIKNEYIEKQCTIQYNKNVSGFRIFIRRLTNL